MPMPRTLKSHLLQEASLAWVCYVVDERIDVDQWRPNFSAQPLAFQPILIFGVRNLFLVDIACLYLYLLFFYGLDHLLLTQSGLARMYNLWLLNGTLMVRRNLNFRVTLFELSLIFLPKNLGILSYFCNALLPVLL